MEDIEKIFLQKANYYDDILSGFNDFRQGVFSIKSDSLQFFVDLCFFSIMFSYNLWIVRCDYYKATKKYQQNYYCRQMVLLVYEFLNKNGHFFGGSYRNLIGKFDNDIKEKLLNIQKNFNKLANDNLPNYKEIRDKVIGHMDVNIDEQISIINGLDQEKILYFSKKISEEVEKLHIILNEVIKIIGNESKDNKGFLLKYQN